MRRSLARVFTFLAAGGVALPSALARAAELPSSINTPPNGPGTEQVTRRGATSYREGIEAAVAMGSGFADTYGLGLQGRLGYTLREGVYLGGNVQHYLGHAVNDQAAHATFFGGEVGYKFYPTESVEVRPYVFAGPAFITQVVSRPLAVLNKTDFAVQPGVVAMYHFGNAFVGADAHFMATPSPNTVAVLASGGFGF
jgi:hypothetical protein